MQVNRDVEVLLNCCGIWSYGVVAPVDVHVHNVLSI